MTTYLLAGGGTAGHVNPLLATADRLRDRDSDARILVLGTEEGIESRLVPLRGHELLTIPRLPLPRRLDGAALRFPGRLAGTLSLTTRILREQGVDVVVGFGGYVAAPAYLAARRLGLPIVVHEQNAKPGFANRLGAWLTPHVGTTFASTRLRHGRLVGLPLRREIERLDRRAARTEAVELFGLDPQRPLLLVTGGSIGAKRLNETIAATAADLVVDGWDVLHITGSRAPVEDPGLPGYRILEYCDRMELAIAASAFAVSRAGAATVSELAAVGVPAMLVPYAVGNGEQRFNAQDAVAAGGALLVDDAAFTPELVRAELLPLLADEDRIRAMAAAMASTGSRDGADRTVDLVLQAAARAGR